MDIVDDKEWTVVTKGYRPKVNETSKIVSTNNYNILTPANKPTIMDTTPPPTITLTTHSPTNSSKKMNKHQRQQYQHMPISMARSTTTRCRLYLWGVRFKSTRRQTTVERGHTTPSMVGTCPPCQSITAHMCAISSPPRAIDCQILSTSSTST
jgi:hypothetical protein